MKRYKRGLVVGKFSPLHQGHEYIISKAFEVCNKVILLSWSEPEFKDYPALKREEWLQTLFPEAVIWVLDNGRIDELQKQGFSLPNLPHNDAPDHEPRNFVFRFCKEILREPISAVFTGETYGDGFAQYLEKSFSNWLGIYYKVDHVYINRDDPVSGTQIRKSIHQYKDLVSPVVYKDFVKKICFIGGESTGKSTLSQHLAQKLKTEWAPEYGRELWESKNGNLCYEDLLHIAETQIERERKLLKTSNRFLFCDTSPLVTLFYSLELFGKADDKLRELSLTTYDKIFLCDTDTPFFQDGTRQNEEFRLKQQNFYINSLQEKDLEVILLQGSLEERTQKVLAEIL